MGKGRKEENISMPLLCKIRLHQKYHYLPKVGGDLREVSIACKRCGYGLRYFTGEWNISPSEVKREISEQAQIEYGRVLGFFRGVEPVPAMRMAFDIIAKKFTEEELTPIRKLLKEVTSGKR